MAKRDAKNTIRGKERLELVVKTYIKNFYIDRIPSYTFQQALRDAGYNETYAHAHCSDIRKRAQPYIDKEKEQYYEESKMNLKDWERELKLLADDCRNKEDRTNLKGCIDMGLKLNQGYINITKDISDNIDIPEAEQELLKDVANTANIQIAKLKQA